MKLNPLALGLTVAIFAAACWLVMMGISLLTGWFNVAVVAIGTFHPFFSYSFKGLAIMVGEHFHRRFYFWLAFRVAIQQIREVAVAEEYSFAYNKRR